MDEEGRQVNADNRGNDWFFESIGDASSTAGERIDTFVNNTKNANVGAQPMITIPMIGYVAKDAPKRHPFTCGFPKTVYAAQDSFDPYDKNCGIGTYEGHDLAARPSELERQLDARG